jgi:hypothetical protein
MTASILHETLATPVAELAQQPGEALHRLQLDAGDLLAAVKAVVEHIDRAVLPIITADQRLAERRGIKGVALRQVRHRQDQPALDAESHDHAVLRPRGRRSGGRGLGRRHAPPAHLAGMPRLRGVHRRAEPGAARGPALQPGAFRCGLRPLRRSHRCSTSTRPSSSTRSPSPGGSACNGARASPGLLREDRQARHPRRLRPAWARK